jgi:endoglucanase
MLATMTLVNLGACASQPTPCAPPAAAGSLTAAATEAGPGVPSEPMAELDAWAAVPLMGRGVNIGNTLENTTQWETGWGNPPITKEFVQKLAALGYGSVRLPVAWDTYAVDERIQSEKLERVSEVANWIIEAGMFCVVNIHWDGGWLDSSNKERFAATHATFSPAAERKFRAYWRQIATYFAGKNEKLLFEALNEETNFENEGSPQKAYATLTRVNQLFIDTVRGTGKNNAKRLLIVAGYSTDIMKTTSTEYKLPVDTIPHRLFISVHYYTPWTFVGLTEDASWGKMAPTWGTEAEVAEQNRLFDAMRDFCTKNDLPAFIGEYGASEKKERPSRVRWMTAVTRAALSRKMVPALWDTGNDLSRRPPYDESPALREVLQNLTTPAASK